MAKKFSELKKKMKPDQQRRAEAKTREMLAEMLLAEIRKEAGFTQEDIAQALGIKQPGLSRLESQDDMQISTLTRVIKALGGHLELIAHMPSGDIRIRQFET